MKTFFQILVCLLFLQFLYSQTANEEHLVLKPSVEQFHSLTWKSGLLMKYFKITIDKKVPEEDLVIMVRPVEDISDPDIFISRSFNYPNSYGNADLVCTSNGMDVCPILSENITDNSTFYIGIKCYTQCSFALKAIYDSQSFFTLQENPNMNTLTGSYNLKYDDNDAKIVKFFIPENKQNYQRVLVKVQQVHPMMINESFSMYMNEGNSAPSSSRYHFTGIEAWNSGQCILISDYISTLWTTSKFSIFSRSYINYTLLIQAPKGSNLNLNVIAYNDLVKVKLHQNLQDMVYMDNKITYELDLDDVSTISSNFGSSNFLLTLTAFSGNPDIYVNPDTLPSTLDQYRWKSNEEGKETLIITPQERQVAKATDRKFYITIYGKFTSTFSLWLGTSATLNYLMFGVSQSGAIENDEIINYRLFILSDEMMNVTVTLNTETGNPDLYLKMCILSETDTDWRTAREERLKCLVSLEDVHSRYSKTPGNANLFYFSDNVGNKDVITFLHDSEKCFQQNQDMTRPFAFNKCMYVIAVHGNCNWQNESQFSLVATHIQQHIILIEGNPQRVRSDLGNLNYFKFTLFDENDIDSIIFHVTEISGRVSTYISRKNRYPSEKDYDKMSYSHWGGLKYQLSDLKNDSIKTLAGTYYITVVGDTASTFSLLVSVNRQNKKKKAQIQTIKLAEGVPQYYSFIANTNEKHYFIFKTSFSNLTSNVMIHLTPLRGDLRLYVLNTHMSELSYPTPESYHFLLESNENSLLIKYSDNNWSRKAKYVILVEPVSNDTGNLFEFVLQYSTSESMKSLSSHNPLKEVVKNDSYAFYRCEAHRGDESIEISINIHTYNPSYKVMLQVFFSFKSSNPFPDEKNNEFNTTVQNNIWILVENSDLTTNCPYLFQDNLNYSKQCVFYMSIRSFEIDAPEIIYSINTKRNFIQKPITVNYHYLTDNLPKSIHYNPLSPEPLFFIYKLEDINRTLHISAFTQEFYYGSNFYLYADIKTLSNNMTAQSLNELFPKGNTSKITADSMWHHSVSITVHKTLLNSLDCSQIDNRCVLFITILLKNESHLSYYNPSANSSITIQVTRKLLLLTPGVPYKGLVAENEIKYFRLDIVNEEKTNVLISVTPLNDGDPDLIVNKGVNKEWPELYQYDFASKNTNADQLSISHTRDENNLDNNSYVIGVYGKANCSFVLTATYGDFHLVNIYSGNPTGFTLKAKEKVYFLFKNYVQADFRVIFSKEYGDYLFAMTTLQDNEDFIEKLPDFKKKNYFWSNLVDSKDQDHIFIRNDSINFCKNCSYIIVVEAEKESSLTVLISNGNTTIFLQQAKSLKDFVTSNRVNSYVSYFYEESSKVIVNILVYHGKIKASLYNSSDPNDLIMSKNNENTNNIQLVYEPKNSTYWYYTMAYIVVEGISNSNFTIEVHSIGKDRKIRYGITEYGEASPLLKYNFTFFSNADQDNDQYYSVTLKTNTHNKTSNNSTTNQSYLNRTESIMGNTSLEVIVTNEKSERIPIYTFISRSQNYIYARFRAIKGNYVICVNNSRNYNYFSYNLLLSFSGLDLIYNDMEYFNYLNVGKASYYQLLIEDSGKVLVELFQCYGKNRLYVASNQISIINHQSDLISELENSISSNQIINMYDIKNLNEIYIAVKSIEGGNNDLFSGETNNTYKISRYLLKTHFVKSGQTPYEVFYPGNDGKIKYTNSDGLLMFSIKRLTCEKDCKNALKSKLKNAIKYYQYTIRINYDENYLEESVTCFQLFNGSYNNKDNNLESAVIFAESFMQLEDRTDLNFTLTLSNYKYRENTPYFAKILGQVFIDENYGTQPYSFFYKTVEFYPGSNLIISGNNEAGSGMIWMLVIVFLALFGAVAVAFFFFKRYRTTVKQLNYELQDVRNVARVEDGGVNRKDYIGLINENKA